jgi:hypothetical protein
VLLGRDETPFLLGMLGNIGIRHKRLTRMLCRKHALSACILGRNLAL